DSEEIRLTFGDLLRSHGRIDRALGEYDRALELDPALEGAIVGRALCLAESGRGDEAARYLGELRQTLPTRRRIPTTQAQILLAFGSPEAIAEALTIARDANSNKPTIASAVVLALALAHSGDFEEAAGWQSRALAAMPADASWAVQRQRAGDRLAAYHSRRKIPATLDAGAVLALSLTQPLNPEDSTPS
ncbi:MAG: tetratricopeptide repeat protein, partial [Acidobacteria bacterium]|nr:tetratricopeptide repeat protein [Acidobacteriota bacterium]